MAPEQAQGNKRAISPAVDVYALGAILYHALTGKTPFAGEDAVRVVARLAAGETPSLSKVSGGLPRDLVTICARCLEAQPARRYASAEALADDLGRYLRGEPIHARPVGELERLWKWARRHRALAAALAAVALALVAGTAVSTFFAIIAGQRAEEARGREAEARAARHEAERETARAEFARGYDLAAQGDGVRGLHGMLAALYRAPPGDADLQRVLHTSVAAWSVPLFDLRQVLTDPGGLPRDLAFRPDTGAFAVLWDDGVQRYDTAGGKAQGGRLRCPGGRCLAFSPDGRRLLAGTAAGAVCAWDAATGAEVPPLPAEAGADVRQLGLAPDGQTLFTAHGNGAVRLWDAATGRPRGQAITGVSVTWPVRFGPDGRRLFAVTRDGWRLRQWDAQSGRPLEVPPIEGVTQYGFGPDGATILTLQGATLTRRDLRTGRALGEPLTPANSLSLPPDAQRIALSPDGAQALIKDELGTYVLWDLAARRPLGEVARLEGGEAVFSPDGRYLLTWETPSAVRLWEVNLAAWRSAAGPGPVADPEARPAGAAVGRAALSPDGATAALLLGDRVVQLWDTAAGRPVGRPLRHPYPIHTMVFDPAGRRLAATCFIPQSSGMAENRVEVWDLATQKPLWAAAQPLAAVGLGFSPDGRTLAVGGYTTRVRLYDAATGRRSAGELSAGAIIHSLLFSPDGKVLAAGCWNTPSRPGGVQLWDVAAGRALVPFLPHAAPLPPGGQAINAEAVDAFSPDGAVLLSHGGAGSPMGPQGIGTFRTNVWEVATGRPLFAPLTSTYRVHLGPDGQTLITSDWDRRTLHLRDAATGQLRRHGVLNLPAPVKVLALSPDSRLLAAGYSNRFQLWDVATGLPVGPPAGPQAALVAAGFTDEGRTLVTAAADGSVHRWPVPSLPKMNVPALTLAVQLCTQARVATNGELVYLDGPATTACWKALRAASRGAPPADWHDAAATRAEEVGDSAAARWHLQRLAALRPDDWQPYARLARLHAEAGEAKEADRACALAGRHAPAGAMQTWYAQRAAACAASGRWQPALWYLDRAVAADPNDWSSYAARAEALANLGNIAERDEDRARAVAHGGDGPFLVGLAEDQARHGRWPEAVALFARALRQGPVPWHHAALAALRAGDAAAYRRVCAALLAWEPALDWNDANNRAVVFGLGPDAVADWSGPLGLVEQALAGFEGRLRETPPAAGSAFTAQTRHAYLNTKGTLLYRAGRYAEAVAALTQGVQAEGGQLFPHDGFLLAMAHERLGRKKEAQAWMDRALGAANPAGDLWGGLEVELLKEEAARRLRRP
jgi:WD40 repeat protein/predicted Zn-dependent protease